MSANVNAVYAELVSLEVHEREDPISSGYSDSYFCYLVIANIIKRDGPREIQEFEMDVCSPEWFARNWRTDRTIGSPYKIWDRYPDVVPGIHFWFMEIWNQNDVEGALKLICERSSPAPSWSVLANRIGRHLQWEFAGDDDRLVNYAAGLEMPPRPGN